MIRAAATCLALIAAILASRPAVAETSTTAADRGSLPAPCIDPLTACESRLYRSAVVGRSKAERCFVELDACRASCPAQAILQPPKQEITVRAETGAPRWVWTVIGISVIATMIGGGILVAAVVSGK